MSIEATVGSFLSGDLEVKDGLGPKVRGVGLRVGRLTLVGAMWVIGCPGDDIIAATVGSAPSNTGQNFGMESDELIARFKMEKDSEENARNFGKFSIKGSIGQKV